MELIEIFKNIVGHSEHFDRLTIYVKGKHEIKDFEIKLKEKTIKVSVIDKNESGKII
jgi:hypothetical protein